MYAVLVLAAILLSVAPMHASTVLASLTQASSSQRPASAGQDRGRKAENPAARAPRTLTGRIALRVKNPQQPGGREAFGPPQLAHLLEHSPNAP